MNFSDMAMGGTAITKPSAMDGWAKIIGDGFTLSGHNDWRVPIPKTLGPAAGHEHTVPIVTTHNSLE